MEQVFENYLFNRNVLVGEKKQPTENAFAVIYTLAKEYAIKVENNQVYADQNMVEICKRNLGWDVADPFYRNFPNSVRDLSENEIMYDRLANYAMTYGIGCFDGESRHSLFEEEFERSAFDEHTEIRNFEIMPETEAMQYLVDIGMDMLEGTRPLDFASLVLLERLFAGKHIRPEIVTIKSKYNSLYFFTKTKDPAFIKDCVLSDIPKFVEILAHIDGCRPTKLNLSNQHRKIITKAIRYFIVSGRLDFVTCYEKRDAWCGLLHHIHFKTENKEMKEFINAIRSKNCVSV